MIHPALYVNQTPAKGNGVFTHEDLPADQIIELSPVIVMSLLDREHLDKTLLHDYIFEWGEKKDRCAMALGLVPVYNHSYASNCEYFMDYEEDMIFVKTVRAISKGEELTINYNGDWNDETPVWFEVV
jgi:hypothetical protein